MKKSCHCKSGPRLMAAVMLVFLLSFPMDRVQACETRSPVLFGVGLCRGTAYATPTAHPDAGTNEDTDPSFAWAATALTTPVYSVAVSPAYTSDRTLFAGGEGTVWRSIDGGVSWTATTLALGQVNALAVSPNFIADHTVLAAVLGSGLYRSTDTGNSWTRVNSNPNIYSLALSPAYGSDQTIFFGGVGAPYSGAYRSRDGGNSWTSINSGLHNVFVFSLVTSPDYASDHTLFAGTNGFGFMSANEGDSWNRVLGGWPYLLGAIGPMAISSDYTSDGAVFAVEGSRNLWQRNMTGTWRRVSVSTMNLLALAISPQFATDRALFLGTDQGGLWFSSDAGGTWTIVNPSSAGFVVRALAVPGPSLQTIFAATTQGVWKAAREPWLGWENPNLLLVLPSGGAEVVVSFGNIPLPAGLVAALSGPATFPDGSQTFSADITTANGSYTLQLRPAPGAIPGSAFTLRVTLAGVQLERTGTVVATSFLPLLQVAR